MPNKIKIAFVLVAIVAVFSVYELAQYVHVIANKSSSIEEGTPLPNPDDDPDHDGLTNQQEIIWGTDPFNPDTDGDGFKDGEEVQSGHNPLIPGPNDLLGADNLTEKLSNLAVDGLAEGSLQSDSPKYQQSLADITSSVADSAKYIFNKTINDTTLATVSTTPQADTIYLKATAPYIKSFGVLLADQYQHVADNLNIIGQSGFTDQSLQSYFATQASQYQDIFDKTSAIAVPQNLKAADAQFISLAMQMHDICDAIAHGANDPIKASVALDSLGDMYNRYVSLIGTYKDVLGKVAFDSASLDMINSLTK